MLHRLSSVAIAFAFVAAAGCASSKSTPEATQAGTTPVRRSSTNVITSEEIAKSTARNALDAVQALRPQWIRGRGPNTLQAGSSTELQVYVDGQRFGPPSYLDQIPITQIKEMRFLSGSEATNRFGTGHTGGAILITTLR